MNIPFILNWTKRKPSDKGVRISLLGNYQGKDFEYALPAEGVWIAGGVNCSGDYKGIKIAGPLNIENKELYGVSCGLFNYSESNGKFTFQIGAVNNILKYNPKGVVIQIGLHNRVENQSSPFINIKGFGKSKKNEGKELESRVDQSID